MSQREKDVTVVIDPFALADPVQTVLAAHDSRQRIALSTSGTTTSPRTLVRTTDSWWRSFDAYGRLTGVARGGRLWVPGPLTATMNLFAAVHATVVGAQIVGTPGEATDACLTPAQLDRLGHLLPDDARICVAGARLPEWLVSERVVCYYGAAESAREEATFGWSHRPEARPRRRSSARPTPHRHPPPMGSKTGPKMVPVEQLGHRLQAWR